MGRFLVDVPEEDLGCLDELAKREGKSRAAVIRDADKLYLVHIADYQDWIMRWAK